MKTQLLHQTRQRNMVIILLMLRCANCFECPSCGNALIVRVSTVAIPSDNPEEKATAKKVFYLGCGFCRWSTRDVAIPDRNNGRLIR